MYALLIFLLYLPLFRHLDFVVLRHYDESRLAINALEMIENKQYLQTFYEGKPDMWNTKPPLMIWIQAAFIQLLGPNELAIRLPAALAALLTCMMLMYFSETYLKSFWPGCFASLILISSSGFVGLHTARTGDYDALLTLFTTAGCFFFFLFDHSQKPTFIYLFFVSISLGILTKGIAGALFIPAFCIYMIYRRRVRKLLFSFHFLSGLLFLIVFVSGYYLLREHLDPGYLKTVYENELGGRYLKTLENHHESFWYYLQNIRMQGFREWYMLLPAGLAFCFFTTKKPTQRLYLYLFLLSILYLLIISCSQTKLEWYAMPLYPLMAMICAMPVYEIFCFLQSQEHPLLKKSKHILPPAFLFLCFTSPYNHILDQTYFPQEGEWDKHHYSITYLLREGIRGTVNLNNRYFVCTDYNPHNMFYVYALQHKGVNIRTKKLDEIITGDTILLFENNCRKYVQLHFLSSTIYEKGNAGMYAIDKKIQ